MIVAKEIAQLQENLNAMSALELKNTLKNAIRNETYELAAACRDELAKRETISKRKIR